MRLSPWEPPRFVVTAIQGVCGVTIRAGDLTFNPLIPAEWEWVGLRRFLYHGRELAFFGARQPGGTHVFTTGDFEVGKATQKHLYNEDVTTRVYTLNPLVEELAFRKPGEILGCLGSSATQTMLFPMRLDHLLEHNTTYQVEVYSSEWNRWITGETGPGYELEESAIQIEAGGYWLLRFKEQR